MKSSKSQINLSKKVSHMANQRTILAHVRTFLVLLATGVAFQELFDKPLMLLIGKFLIVFSLVLLLFGVISFFKMRKAIKKQKKSVAAQFLD